MATPLIADAGTTQLAALLGRVKDFVASRTDHDRTRSLRDRGQGYEPAIVGDMAALGWTGLLVPARHGGLGLGVAALAATAKELARGLLAEPLAAAVAGAGTAIARGDNPALQAELLRDIAAGRALPALAWQEAADGADALAASRPETVATRTSDGIRLTGGKRWIAGGPDGYVVSARSHEGAGLGLYWIASGEPGLRARLHPQLDGSMLRTLELANARASAIVATPAAAGDALRCALDAAATIACAELCGHMEWLLEAAAAHLRLRAACAPAAGWQGLQQQAVDLYVQHELSVCATLDAIAAVEADPAAPQASRNVSRAKARCSDAGVRIAREAAQMLGAAGFAEDHPAGLHLKRTLVLAAAFGTARQHRQRHGSPALQDAAHW